MPGMTPMFSRQLALVAQAPYWRTPAGMARWLPFLDQVTQYPTFAQLPPDLKALCATAVASLGAPRTPEYQALARLMLPTPAIPPATPPKTAR